MIPELSSDRGSVTADMVDAPPKKRILLAEDNAVNQRLAIKLLEKFGYHVTLAENGRRAVDIAEVQAFDLILMDVQMPEMGGFEATAKIRELEEKIGKHTPIIAMTAHAIQGYREKCLEGGMVSFFLVVFFLKCANCFFAGWLHFQANQC
jgi:CheY-like chemotaxis protein